MNLHEYQAKSLFRSYGVKVPDGYFCTTPVEAEFAFRRLHSPVCVVKAQVHAGGRGKGGGVKLVRDPKECYTTAEKMLGMNLVTHQTGAEGKIVRKIYVEAGSDIAKEYYLAMLVDREKSAISLMFSKEGGMDIEELAETHPEKIITLSVNPITGLRSFHFNKISFLAGLDNNEATQLKEIITKLYQCFREKDLSLLEINPLIVTKSHEMLALDAKISVDENALYRQRDLEAMRDFDEENEREVEASKHKLSYIGLDGNIGCLVNGAGLAMATMDIIKHYGGDPANFLDVGGGATQEMVTNAFRLILQDKSVKGVFVNIFGGIMQCDIIAKGICAASSELGIKIPLVVRLEGTNVEEGKKIIATSGLNVIIASDMADGAKRIVAACR